MQFQQYSEILGDPLYESINISSLVSPVYVAGARQKTASTANKYFSKRIKSLPKRPISIFSYQEYTGGGPLDALDAAAPSGICPSFSQIAEGIIGAAEKSLEEFANILEVASDDEAEPTGHKERKEIVSMTLEDLDNDIVEEAASALLE